MLSSVGTYSQFPLGLVPLLSILTASSGAPVTILVQLLQPPIFRCPDQVCVGQPDNLSKTQICSGHVPVRTSACSASAAGWSPVSSAGWPGPSPSCYTCTRLSSLATLYLSTLWNHTGHLNHHAFPGVTYSFSPCNAGPSDWNRVPLHLSANSPGSLLVLSDLSSDEARKSSRKTFLTPHSQAEMAPLCSRGPQYFPRWWLTTRSCPCLWIYLCPLLAPF